MYHLIRATMIAVAVAVGLAGCGDSSSSGPGSAAGITAAASTARHEANTRGTASTHKEEQAPTVEKVEIASPVVAQGGTLPSRYTCDGKDVSPPLTWKGIPAGTKELMLDVIKINLVNKKLYFAWAVTGLDPHSRGIRAGRLPSSSIVGRNSAGRVKYELCPPKHTNEKYVAALFALRRRLAAKPGFDATALRQQALIAAKYEGFLIFSYPR